MHPHTTIPPTVEKVEQDMNREGNVVNQEIRREEKIGVGEEQSDLEHFEEEQGGGDLLRPKKKKEEGHVVRKTAHSAFIARPIGRPRTGHTGSARCDKRSRAAGLTLSVSRVEAWLRREWRGRVAAAAPTYLTAVLEYLLSELFEVGSQAARRAGQETLTPHHINSGAYSSLLRVFCSSVFSVFCPQFFF